MTKENKQHFYCLSFSGKELDSGRDCSASAYVGYDYKNAFTLPEIQRQKSHAGVTDDSVLIAITYLGRMTKSEMLGDCKNQAGS